MIHEDKWTIVQEDKMTNVQTDLCDIPCTCDHYKQITEDDSICICDRDTGLMRSETTVYKVVTELFTGTDIINIIINFISSNESCDYVSFIFPENDEIISANLSKCDFKKFSKLLNIMKENDACILPGLLLPNDDWYNTPITTVTTSLIIHQITEIVGYHLKKKCVMNLCEKINTPIQMFFGSPQNWTVPVFESSQLSKIRDNVDAYGLKVFVHGAYIINLCNSEVSLDMHIADLILAKKCGYLGVVVHVGKNVAKFKHSTNEEALEAMIANIEIIIEHATNECPLILETPAGQGTETLVSLRVFTKFCKKMYNKYGRKFGVCIDTCHVFSCGYDPLYYLQQFHEKIEGCLRLVHFNDSKSHLGRRVDRHAYVGPLKCSTHNIGLIRMHQVANWCFKNDIPAVIE